MARYSSKKLSPFDGVEVKQTENAKKGIGDLFRKNFYLSTRACIFMAGYSLTLACLVASFGRMYIPILLALGCVLIWTFVLRYVENCRTIVLNVFLNTALFAGLYFLPVVAPDPMSFYCYVPLIIGLTALSSSIRDGRAYFTRSDILEEIIVPGVISSFAVLLAAVISKYLFEQKKIGIMLIISAITVGAVSFLLSKATGKKIRLTSNKLADIADYHPINFEENIRFLKERLVFSGECIAVLAGMLAVNIADLRFSLKLPFALLPIVASVVIVIFMLLSKRRFDDVFACESMIAVAVLPLMPSVIGVFTAVAADIVIASFLHTYKRSKLFADINSYFDGLPMLMTVLGMAILIIEAFI